VLLPVSTLQKFDGAKKDFENGVFLGPIAHLTFNGPYDMTGKQLWFDVVNMNIGLGPLKFSIPLKKDAKAVADMDSTCVGWDGRKLLLPACVHVLW
jgi:hypothetical protein